MNEIKNAVNGFNRINIPKKRINKLEDRLENYPTYSMDREKDFRNTQTDEKIRGMVDSARRPNTSLIGVPKREDRENGAKERIFCN